MFKLLLSERISGMPFRVQSAFVAYSDRTPVEGTAMCPHLEQSTMLTDRTIATDIKMITDSTKPTGTMVTQELFHSIVTVAASSRTVQNNVAYRIDSVHHQPVLHPSEEFALIAHLLLTYSHRKCFLYHGSRHSMAVEQLVTPSAVSAAMAAWIIAFSKDTQVILFFVSDMRRFIIYNL
jgi:hypothetical protein